MERKREADLHMGLGEAGRQVDRGRREIGCGLMKTLGQRAREGKGGLESVRGKKYYDWKRKLLGRLGQDKQED